MLTAMATHGRRVPTFEEERYDRECDFEATMRSETGPVPTISSLKGSKSEVPPDDDSDDVTAPMTVASSDMHSPAWDLLDQLGLGSSLGPDATDYLSDYADGGAYDDGTLQLIGGGDPATDKFYGDGDGEEDDDDVEEDDEDGEDKQDDNDEDNEEDDEDDQSEYEEEELLETSLSLFDLPLPTPRAGGEGSAAGDEKLDPVQTSPSISTAPYPEESLCSTAPSSDDLSASAGTPQSEGGEFYAEPDDAAAGGPSPPDVFRDGSARAGLWLARSEERNGRIDDSVSALDGETDADLEVLIASLPPSRGALAMLRADLPGDVIYEENRLMLQLEGTLPGGEGAASSGKNRSGAAERRRRTRKGAGTKSSDDGPSPFFEVALRGRQRRPRVGPEAGPPFVGAEETEASCPW